MSNAILKSFVIDNKKGRKERKKKYKSKVVGSMLAITAARTEHP